jgi:hypothetical protein
MKPKTGEWRGFFAELLKWGIVVLLIWPVFHPKGGLLEFTRVVIGEALLIIFIGKLFYDTVIWKFTRTRRSAKQNFAALLGMLVAIGTVMILFFLLVGFTLLQYFQNVRSGLR